MNNIAELLSFWINGPDGQARIQAAGVTSPAASTLRMIFPLGSGRRPSNIMWASRIGEGEDRTDACFQFTTINKSAILRSRSVVTSTKKKAALTP
jgi:hypothetical protein